MTSKAQFDMAIDTIRDRLLLLCNDSGPQTGVVFSLFSRVPGEGVTSLAVALGRSVAERNDLRAVLISYGVGRDSLVERLGLQVAAVTGPVSSEAPLPVVASDITGLDCLLLDGDLPSGYAGDEGWKSWLERVKTTYQVVIVDAGSTRSPHAGRWSRWADQRVLVIDSRRTTEQELLRLRTDLDAQKQAIDVAVMNKRRFYVPQVLYRHVN